MEEMTKVIIIDDYEDTYEYLNLTKEQMRLLEYLSSNDYFEEHIKIRTIAGFETV